MPGSSSWMPYAPQGVKEFDDDLYSWMFRVGGCSEVGGTYLQITRRHIPEHNYLHKHDHDSHQYHSSAIALKVGKSMEFLRENKLHIQIFVLQSGLKYREDGRITWKCVIPVVFVKTGKGV